MTLYYPVKLEVVVHHCCCCSHDQWLLTNHWHFQNCSVARRKETLKQNLTKKLSTKSKYLKKRGQETSLFTIVGFSIYKYNVVSENITKHCNLLKFTIVGFSVYKYNVVSENITKHCNLLKFTIVGFSVYKYNVVSKNRTKHCNLLKFTIVGFSIYRYNVVSKNRMKHCNLLKLFYYEGHMSSVLKLFVE